MASPPGDVRQCHTVCDSRAAASFSCGSASISDIARALRVNLLTRAGRPIRYPDVIRTYAISLTALWALIVSPMLCVGGVISHACAPHDDRTIAASCECAEMSCACDDHDAPCSHEGDCSSDPCRVDVTARGAGQDPVEFAVCFDDMVVPVPVISQAPSVVSPFSLEGGPPIDRSAPCEIHPINTPLLV